MSNKQKVTSTIQQNKRQNPTVSTIQPFNAPIRIKILSIGSLDVKVNFWDLSGHAEFFDIRNEFYKDVQGCLLVYDVTSKESFQECDSWISEGNKFGLNSKDIPIAVCANKIDRFQNRVISEDEGKQYAQARGFQYFETSAYTGDNINEMFQYLFQIAVKKMMSV
eukprot:gene20808-26975_t